MKKIKLTKGQYTIVDNEDFELLNKYKWQAGFFNKKDFYAMRSIETRKDKKRKRISILMHRIILKASKKLNVDHINHDTLDNRKHNLRLATKVQNGGNRKISCSNSSGYKGVSWNTNRQKYLVQIKYKGKSYNLGGFKDKKKAALMYNLYSKKFFGEYALLNTIRE